MLKTKNLLLIAFAIFFTACSQYNKVLNKGTAEEKYKMATELYESKKFSKALRLFEIITPVYKGKPQMERIQFMVAQSYFNTKDFESASYYFGRFSENFPKSTKREEADFNAAKSGFLASPKYSVDQTLTLEALASFQKFINTYPTSKRLEASNKMVSELQQKLEKKSFMIAKQYYDIGYFKSAITAFDNLTSEYLGTIYREKAFFYKFKASYELGVNSTYAKKLTRLNAAQKAFEKLKRNYPSSEYLKESERMLKRINKEKAILTS